MLYSANYDLCMSMYLVDRANKKPHNKNTFALSCRKEI